MGFEPAVRQSRNLLYVHGFACGATLRCPTCKSEPHTNNLATVDFRLEFGLFFEYSRNFAENWAVRGATLREALKILYVHGTTIGKNHITNKYEDMAEN